MLTFFVRLVAILEALPARRSFHRFAVLSVLCVVGSSATSFADFITYNLGQGNAQVSGFPAPYGTVQVNLTDSTHATITFTANPNPPGGAVYRFGDGQSIDVNVNAGSWTVSNLMITDGASTGTLSIASPQPSGNVDGFGNFNQRFDDTTGGATPFVSASFVLTDTSGTWANASSVLADNGNGFHAAAHVFAYSSPTDTSATVTGFATDSGTISSVPEPATIVTLATALPIGLLALRRRFRGYPVTE
jgi:hypothetical protein